MMSNTMYQSLSGSVFRSFDEKKHSNSSHTIRNLLHISVPLWTAGRSLMVFNQLCTCGRPSTDTPTQSCIDTHGYSAKSAIDTCMTCKVSKMCQTNFFFEFLRIVTNLITNIFSALQSRFQDFVQSAGFLLVSVTGYHVRAMMRVRVGVSGRVGDERERERETRTYQWRRGFSRERIERKRQPDLWGWVSVSEGQRHRFCKVMWV